MSLEKFACEQDIFATTIIKANKTNALFLDSGAETFRHDFKENMIGPESLNVQHFSSVHIIQQLYTS